MRFYISLYLIIATYVGYVVAADLSLTFYALNAEGEHALLTCEARNNKFLLPQNNPTFYHEIGSKKLIMISNRYATVDALCSGAESICQAIQGRTTNVFNRCTYQVTFLEKKGGEPLLHCIHHNKIRYWPRFRSRYFNVDPSSAEPVLYGSQPFPELLSLKGKYSESIRQCSTAVFECRFLGGIAYLTSKCNGNVKGSVNIVRSPNQFLPMYRVSRVEEARLILQ